MCSFSFTDFTVLSSGDWFTESHRLHHVCIFCCRGLLQKAGKGFDAFWVCNGLVQNRWAEPQILIRQRSLNSWVLIELLISCWAMLVRTEARAARTARHARLYAVMTAAYLSIFINFPAAAGQGIFFFCSSAAAWWTLFYPVPFNFNSHQRLRFQATFVRARFSMIVHIILLFEPSVYLKRFRD